LIFSHEYRNIRTVTNLCIYTFRHTAVVISYDIKNALLDNFIYRTIEQQEITVFQLDSRDSTKTIIINKFLYFET